MTPLQPELWTTTRNELRAYSIGALLAGMGFGIAISGHYAAFAAVLLAGGVLLHGWGMHQIYSRNR